jgi:hypothetical protein
LAYDRTVFNFFQRPVVFMFVVCAYMEHVQKMKIAPTGRFLLPAVVRGGGGGGGAVPVCPLVYFISDQRTAIGL